MGAVAEVISLVLLLSLSLELLGLALLRLPAAAVTARRQPGRGRDPDSSIVCCPAADFAAFTVAATVPVIASTGVIPFVLLLSLLLELLLLALLLLLVAAITPCRRSGSDRDVNSWLVSGHERWDFAIATTAFLLDLLLLALLLLSRSVLMRCS